MVNCSFVMTFCFTQVAKVAMHIECINPYMWAFYVLLALIPCSKRISFESYLSITLKFKYDKISHKRFVRFS